MLKRTIKTVGFMVAALGMSSVAMADAVDNFSPNTDINDVCEITNIEALDFGIYNPFDTADKTADADISVRCNEGTTTTIKLDMGSNALGSQRRLKSGSLTDKYVLYNLFKEVTWNNIWGDGTNSTTGVTATPGYAGTNYTVYAKAPKNQSETPTAADYTDTIQVTVTF